nr:gamma-butyrobetaine dioxygenase-like [Procambarus clarkii]XP_045617058.1 gamma-butyrobetaine dioxygenase-like [Procambarus clarkii]XP_045617059.1 gamma-butyrobetaine dioxygenase-like [Procambarus clarkii]XP_045617060.1 gamma-butyrobetaine dioxygenase-like [Procambarus clarkii]
MQVLRHALVGGTQRHSFRRLGCITPGLGYNISSTACPFRSLFLSSRPCCGMEREVKKIWKVPEMKVVEEAGENNKKEPLQKKSCTVTVASVTVNHITRMLEVNWTAGETDVFPYVWLRDNCLCSACFHAVSNSRLHLIKDFDLHAQPSTVQVLGEGKQVEVVWSDGHIGKYPAAWLRPRAFNATQRFARTPKLRLNRIYWDAKLLENIPQASFQELLQDDTVLLSWLQQLEVMGFVLVSGAPSEPGQVYKLAERVGFIKKTHYGESFTVKKKQDPSNVAYLSGPLQLHGDLPYYEYMPGVQFIHCIVQYEGEGGESLVTDAVHVAHELKRLHPEKYRILTDTPVDWFDIGTDELGEFYKVLKRPMICVDAIGEIQRINLSQPQRDSFFSIPANEVAGWYNAMVTYYHLLSDPCYCLRFKMAPGSILTFDNLRIVHGRTGYDLGPGERHVEGCYMDWDEVRSRRRVLEVKFGVHSPE